MTKIEQESLVENVERFFLVERIKCTVTNVRKQ